MIITLETYENEHVDFGGRECPTRSKTKNREICLIIPPADEDKTYRAIHRNNGFCCN